MGGVGALVGGGTGVRVGGVGPAVGGVGVRVMRLDSSGSAGVGGGILSGGAIKYRGGV